MPFRVELLADFSSPTMAGSEWLIESLNRLAAAGQGWNIANLSRQYTAMMKSCSWANRRLGTEGRRPRFVFEWDGIAFTSGLHDGGLNNVVGGDWARLKT